MNPTSIDDGLDSMEAFDLSKTPAAVKESGPLHPDAYAWNEAIFSGDFLKPRSSEPAANLPSATLAGALKSRNTLRVSEEISEQIALERSEAAFQEFYEIVAPKMYSLLLHMLRTEDDALDVMQETFIQLWNKAPLLYSKHTNLGAWSHLLARHLALSQMRSGYYKYMKTAQTFDPEVFEDLLRDEHTPDGTLETVEVSLEVQRAIKRLKPEEQKAIELVFFRGFKRKRAAEELGISINKFHALVSTALSELEYALLPHLDTKRKVPQRPVPPSVVQREKRKGAKENSRIIERALRATANVVLTRPPTTQERVRDAAIQKILGS